MPGRPRVETTVRSSEDSTAGTQASDSTARNGTARTTTASLCPVARSSGPPSWHSTIATTAASTPTHAPMRTVRRTSRTAWRRRPSSAAISGEVAPTRPVRLQISRPKIDTANDDAASASAPSRATNSTSTAKTAICSRFAPTSGAARRSISRHSDVACGPARSGEVGRVATVMAWAIGAGPRRGKEKVSASFGQGLPSPRWHRDVCREHGKDGSARDRAFPGRPARLPGRPPGRRRTAAGSSRGRRSFP